jgi:hypothetical protein
MKNASTKLVANWKETGSLGDVGVKRGITLKYILNNLAVKT